MKTEERDSADFLRDILDSIDKIESFIEGFDFDEFTEDEKTVYAVIRALEIIGEATKNLPETLKKDRRWQTAFNRCWLDMSFFNL